MAVVGFIGLGTTGKPMAGHLQRGRHRPVDHTRGSCRTR